MPRFRSMNKERKCMSKEYRFGTKNVIKNKNKEIIYTELKNEIHINFINSLTKKKSIKELTQLYKKVEEIAKYSNKEYITCSTWLFLKYPKLQKRLGFKMVEKTYKNYIRFLKKYNIKEIKRIDLKKSKCICITKDNKKIELEINKIRVPYYMKKVN
jgi:hypothetical protein